MQSLSKTAILIEDDDHVRLNLESTLRSFDDVHITGSCSSAEEGLRAIRMAQPDLLFLNIELPFFTGLEMLGNLPVSSMQIIYIVPAGTKVDEALEFNQRPYLTTPITHSDCQQCLAQLTPNNSVVQQTPVLRDHTSRPPFRLDKIKLPTAHGVRFVAPDDIVYCEAKQENTLVTLTDEEWLVTRSLKYFENHLDSRRFFRIHKSFLLNLEHVDSYSKAEGGSVKTSTQKTIYVGRSRKKEFARVLGL